MQIKRTIKIPASFCFACGTRGSFVGDVHEYGVLPSPGDTVTCQECGHIMAFDNDLRFRELSAEEREIVSMDTLIVPTQCSFEERLEVVKPLLFEQARKRTEHAFPGQPFPERMKPMLYRLVQEYHAAVIEFMAQQILAEEYPVPPRKNRTRKR